VHGFPIVWKDPAATGVKWCYVLIGSRQGAAGAWNGEGSADCPAFGIMLHNGTQTSGTRILTKGKRPDTYGCQRNFFFANEAGITHGAEGTAQSVGPWGPDMFIAAYDNSDGTPAAGEAWGPRSGTYLLKKNTGGFIVLGVVDSVNHYVLVKSDPMDFFRGIVSADVAAGGTGTITVHVGGTDTSQTISGIMNLTDCTIKGSKVGSAQWLWGESAWMFITFGTT
jgi:hypothetical protein